MVVKEANGHKLGFGVERERSVTAKQSRSGEIPVKYEEEGETVYLCDACLSVVVRYFTDHQYD